ncbi:hypothetical protein COB72_00915 [bacterium]|nr:MAG: hypothetical protein COB72_00915 [bacterium]
MLRVFSACYISTALAITLAGCSSPFDIPTSTHSMPEASASALHSSIYRAMDSKDDSSSIRLDKTPESYIRYALYHNPEVERAYQSWQAAAARIPQLASLPDPRLNIGFFLNEVETRVGPQQARVGIQQSFPWISKLRDRQDAGAKAALAAWNQYIAAQLNTTQRVLSTLHDLSYLDSVIKITDENLILLRSFEDIVRTQYRLSASSHSQLIRIQLERAQLEDRLVGFESLRPVYIAMLNAVLNRSSQTDVDIAFELPIRVATQNAEQLFELAFDSNPNLQTLNHRIEQARINTQLAHKQRYPDFTIGLDYIITDQAANSSVSESGDDPVMLSFGLSLPIWQDKYAAAKREAIANRLALSREFDTNTNMLSAQIARALFEHTDAARRADLYNNTLIPKAQESLAASIVAFKTGNAQFIDLIDTQRTLLEFSLAAHNAIAEQGKSLAMLNTLVGHPIETTNTDRTSPNSEDLP